ncbi:receptor-type tyrosine-protein phosphatase delta-like isoform X1 [Sycon ciliatum]|uniref:receptor-type tyrosine-protein phosphatase delta-like isoform X1 n=1 Tax=Sycon ciliatum TaxID=27933 RepID=UPI0031F6EF81
MKNIPSGVLTVTCTATGSWSQPKPTCLPRQCPIPVTPTSGQYYVERLGQRLWIGPFQYADTVRWVCDTGFTGNTDALCQADSTWSKNTPTCTRKSCPDPSAPINGNYTVTGLKYEDSVTYTCRLGYDMQNHPNRSLTGVCMANRMWSSTQPTCERKPSYCESYSPIQNGNISCSGRRIHDICQYQCNYGYVKERTSSIRCIPNTEVNGRWSERGSCSPINHYCEITQIHAPLYGRIEANSTQLNDMAYFQCVDGYDMNVTAEPVKCIVLNQTHGQWSDYTTPECFLPASIAIPQQNVTANISTHVTLRCQVVGTNITLSWQSTESSEHSWDKLGYQITNKSNIHHNTTDSQLEISSVRRADGGTYTCSAWNPISRAQKSIRLIVQEPPDAPSNLSAMAGNFSLAMSWKPPVHTGNLPITDYTVNISAHWPLQLTFSESFPVHEIQKSEHTNTIILHKNITERIKPWTNYTIAMQATNGLGTGPASNTFSIRTAAAAPNARPGNFKFTPSNGSVVHFSWEKIPEQDINGQLLGYEMQYRLVTGDIRKKRNVDCSGECDWTTIQLAANVSRYTVTGLKSARKYTFRIRARTPIPGPFANVTVDTPSSAPPPYVIKHKEDFPPTTTQLTFRYRGIASDQNGRITGYRVLVVDQGAIKRPDLQTRPETVDFATNKDYSLKSTTPMYVLWRAVTPQPTEDIVQDIVLSSQQGTNYFPLVRGHYYTIAVRAYTTKELFTQSNYLEPQTLAALPEEKKFNVLIIVIVILLILLLAALVTLLIIAWRRRQAKKSVDIGRLPPPWMQAEGPPGIGGAGNENAPAPAPGAFELQNLRTPAGQRNPVPRDAFEMYTVEMGRNDDMQYSQEYKLIQETLSPKHPATVGTRQVNAIKNRYSNIKAYDHTRVQLSLVDGDESTDYINANYLPGFSGDQEYIAAQGPVVGTVPDFWRMVWERGTRVIAMVTNCVEKTRDKCARYWPEQAEGALQSGKITITPVDTTTLADFSIRNLDVSMKGEERRRIQHFHFTTWPDHGVPAQCAPLLTFIRRMRSANPVDAGPIVVHCSAGVGRTGTLIVIDTQLQRLEQMGSIDIFNNTVKLRDSRNIMVQQEVQYVFIHKAMLEAIRCGNTEIPADQLHSTIKNLEQINPATDKTLYQEQFERICGDTPAPSATQIHQLNRSPTMRKVQSSKSRTGSDTICEETRVTLAMSPGKEGSDFINANFLTGYMAKRAYIATQGPMENTISDFWRMVWENNVHSIVMLTKEKEESCGSPVEKCHRYWPKPKNEGPERYGSIAVKFLSQERLMEDVIVRNFHISSDKVEDFDSRKVVQYQVTSWREGTVPDRPGLVVELYAQMQRYQQQNSCGDTPIVVHCSSGTGRTGTFCAICTSIDRIKTESAVDIFQIVKAMRQQRYNVVRNEEEYRFCFSTVAAYLDSFDLYGNFR